MEKNVAVARNMGVWRALRDQCEKRGGKALAVYPEYGKFGVQREGH